MEAVLNKKGHILFCWDLRPPDPPWGPKGEFRKIRHLCLKRQPIMPKRTTYYASEIQKKHGKHDNMHKWVPDGSF